MFSQGGEPGLEPKYLVLPLRCLISISLNTPSTSFSQYIMCPSLNKPLAFLPQMSIQLLLFLINFSSFFKIQHRHQSGKWLFPTPKVVKQIRLQVWESQSFNLSSTPYNGYLALGKLLCLSKLQILICLRKMVHQTNHVFSLSSIVPGIRYYLIIISSIRVHLILFTFIPHQL